MFVRYTKYGIVAVHSRYWEHQCGWLSRFPDCGEFLNQFCNESIWLVPGTTVEN